MKIQYLTATGVDSKTNLKELQDINDKYSFMEWGVLFVNKPETNRYPTLDFIQKNIIPLASEVKFAAHLCGNIINLFIEQNADFLNILSHFNRVQLNVATKNMTKAKQEKLIHAIEAYPRNLILQENYSNHEFNLKLKALPHVAYLFDASGGKGISPNIWPDYQEGNFYGYAGGLSDINLSEEISKIESKALHNYVWLDMEGKIRTYDDWFNLTQIEKSAKIVQLHQQKKLKLDI